MTSRRLCASALIVTAVIHLAVVPEHAREWPAAAGFFVALAVVELVLSGVVLARTSPRVLVVGSAISVASAVLWVASRTVGLPIGPEAFTPEAVAAPDLVATALEVFAAAAFARMAVHATGARVPVAIPVHAHR
jgi:hypothetical protein